MPQWPEWWHFEVVFSSHLIDRLRERGVTEIELRTMLEDATAYRPSVMSDRYCVETSRDRERWEIVVEPDELEETLVVVTAYRIE